MASTLTIEDRREVESHLVCAAEQAPPVRDKDFYDQVVGVELPDDAAPRRSDQVQRARGRAISEGRLTVPPRDALVAAGLPTRTAWRTS